jgi:hypothetical protein
VKTHNCGHGRQGYFRYCANYWTFSIFNVFLSFVRAAAGILYINVSMYAYLLELSTSVIIIS